MPREYENFNSMLPGAAATMLNSRPQQQYFTVNRGDDWFNYSNSQDGDILSRPDFLDAVMKGTIDPLGKYKSAGAAYQGFLGLSPNQGPMGLQQWGQTWNPMFLPPGVQAGPATPPTTPPPTPTTPPPTPPPGPKPQTANLNPIPTAGTYWGANQWQSNMLMQGDRYGEFGTSRGL